jgi:uncharacterized protein (TIGR00106 family)
MAPDRSVLLEFSIAPTDKGESLSPYVSRVIDLVDRSGLDYRLTPMGTVLEGSWDECLAVVARCFRELERDCRRISLNLKVDYRAGASGRLEAKIASVEKRLGRAVKK